MNPTDLKKLSRDGVTIFQRYPTEPRYYYATLYHAGDKKTIRLAETADKSFTMAVAARRKLREAGWDALLAVLPKNKNVADVTTTIEDLLVHYRAYKGRISDHTKEHNIAALRSLLLTAGAATAENWTKVELKTLTDDLVWKWKQQILAKAHEPGTLPARTEQLQRSANSILLQARSLFARSRRNDFADFYKRTAGIELPASITGFRTHPAFGGVEKHDYRPPSDQIMAKTLAALTSGKDGQSGSDLDKNLQIAAWCAIGFGLRASEIARAIKDDFKTQDGDTFFDPIWRAKNNKFPLIGVQLDAWKYLQPLLADRQPTDYILAGTTTERTGDIFRQISAWMKTLGWQTTHHIHELRAWAGCQIVVGDGDHGQDWESARRFMRHSQVATTQKYYGHHVKVRIKKVPLPTIIVTPFVPQVLPDAASA